MDEIEAARDALGRFTNIYSDTAPPVDVEELAESLCCLRVRRADDLADVPGAPGPGVALSGMLLPARREVWVNRHEPWQRRRFSVAHEVGHFLLHAHAEPNGVYCRAGDMQLDPASTERLREREANRFAAELLMPEPLVRQQVEHLGVDPAPLGKAFAVSELAMAFRLVNLGYLEMLPIELDQQWREWNP